MRSHFEGLRSVQISRAFESLLVKSRFQLSL